MNQIRFELAALAVATTLKRERPKNSESEACSHVRPEPSFEIQRRILETPHTIAERKRARLSLLCSCVPETDYFVLTPRWDAFILRLTKRSVAILPRTCTRCFDVFIEVLRWFLI